jgi:hypothetical protein
LVQVSPTTIRPGSLNDSCAKHGRIGSAYGIAREVS